VNVPGVRVIRASGEVGAGGVTRIRGSGSLSLSNEPLIYVDGVRVNNNSTAPSEAYNGWSTPSRVNDLNPEEIESIEVLKGPSAASVVGGCPQPDHQDGDRCKTGIFSTGHPLASGASVSGGTDQLRYYFAADFNRDEGYLDYNYQNKYNGRANLTYSTPGDKFR